MSNFFNNFLQYPAKQGLMLVIYILSFAYSKSTAHQTAIRLLQQLSTQLHSLAYTSNLSLPANESSLNDYSFDEWYKKCIAKPYYTEQSQPQPKKYISPTELTKTIDEFIQVNTSLMTQPNVWINDAPNPDSPFFKTQGPLVPIQPFVQKIIVPPDTKIAFHGDFHGDKLSIGKYIKALEQLGYMNGFNIKDRSNFYLIFLGDYVDRGIYGAEVLYTLMRLKIANPHNVFIIRGNHETFTQNKHDGFYNEIKIKYSNQELFNLIRIYDLFPTALYLGSGTTIINYLLCVHGGFELRFDAKNLLSSNKKLAFDWLTYSPDNQLPKNYDIGFMWNDFNVNQDDEKSYSSPRGENTYIYSKHRTQQFLRDYSNPFSNYFLKGIFRAHQHGDRAMVNSILQGHGVSKLWEKNVSSSLWDNIVATFLVAPDTPYGKHYNYDFDAFGIATTAEAFEDWKLDIYNNEQIYDEKVTTISKSENAKASRRTTEIQKALLKKANDYLNNLKQCEADKVFFEEKKEKLEQSLNSSSINDKALIKEKIETIKIFLKKNNELSELLKKKIQSNLDELKKLPA